jgi:hypothetical protein
MSTVLETLHAFGPTTLVVRAVGALVEAMPGGHTLPPYPNLEAALQVLAPGASPEVAAAARANVDDAVAAGVLHLGASVDGADRALVRRTPAGGAAPIEDQASDAVLKALALAGLASRVGTGDPPARVAAFRALPAGEVLLLTWAAVDVILPLGQTDLARLFPSQAEQASRLASVGGEALLEGVVPVLRELVGPMQQVVDALADRSEAAARALAPFVPGLVAGEAGAGERIALQSDRLPIYKWLAARLATEHAIRRATG